MYEIPKAYEIITTNSKISLLDFKNLNELFYRVHGSFKIISWQHQGVYRGKVEKNKIEWGHNSAHAEAPTMEDIYWQRARIFNEKEEFFITRREGKIIGRHRQDGKGDKVNMIKSDAVLRSIVVDPKVKKANDKLKERIQIINYLGYDDIGKVRVADMRFVNFKMI